MARRRTLNGRPLLMAVVGTAFSVAGCAGGDPVSPPPGNLMPPPMISDAELCIETVPADAIVTVDGVPATPGCVKLPEGYEGRPVTVHVEAPGHVPQDVQVTLEPKMAVSVTLVAGAITPPPPPPMGNLMPPPPPTPPPDLEVTPMPKPTPPVGNLMPPPPQPSKPE